MLLSVTKKTGQIIKFDPGTFRTLSNRLTGTFVKRKDTHKPQFNIIRPVKKFFSWSSLGNSHTQKAHLKL